MANKIENIFYNIFGYHPCDIEPPICGQKIQKMIAEARENQTEDSPWNNSTFIYEDDNQQSIGIYAEIHTPEGIMTVVQRQNDTGWEYAIIFDEVTNTNHIYLGEDEWFTDIENV